MKAWSWLLARASDLGGVAIMAVALFVCVDVLARRLAASPLHGAWCYVEVALVWVIWSSVALAEHRERQIRIDWLSKRMRGKAMYLLRATTALLALVFFGMLTWQVSLDWLHSWSTHEFGYEVRIPMIIPRGALVLGAALMCAELLRKFSVNMWAFLSSLFRFESTHRGAP